jgi:hypothetical protein
MPLNEFQEIITEIFNSLTEDQLTKLSSSMVLVGGKALTPHFSHYLVDPIILDWLFNCNIVGTLRYFVG